MHFSENQDLTPVTPGKPLTYKWDRGSQAIAYAWVTWIHHETYKRECIFNETKDFTLVTPNDPRLTFDPINVIEGLKLMRMYELHVT